MKMGFLFSLLATLGFADSRCLEILSMRIAVNAPGIRGLLAGYRQDSGLLSKGITERFTGVGKKDVYNPTAPFFIDGIETLAARVESRHSEKDTEIQFFQKLLGHWIPIKGAPVLKLQDPFHIKIGEEHIIGGVDNGPNGYKTVFYRGTGLGNLEKFAEGPLGMKDIRLSTLPDGKVLVFTRPQGKIAGSDYDAGPGKIGVITLNSLADLTPQNILKAKILEGVFADKEWGGVNEVLLLKDGKIGILMHIARFDEKGDRHYYPAAMTYDPHLDKYSKVKILLERKNLPHGLKGQSKRPDLADVLFSGGMTLHDNGTATLYLGAGDAQVNSILIKNPFLP